MYLTTVIELLFGFFRCEMEEKKDEEESTLNEGEAEVAIAHANRLVHSGVLACNIEITSPYNAQDNIYRYTNKTAR